MTIVRLKPGESVDNLMKRFRRALDNGNVLDEIKEKMFYLSPSEERNVANEKLKHERRKEKRRRERHRSHL